MTGLLSFGRDPLWENLCKESLLWEGERADGGEEEEEKEEKEEKEVGPKEKQNLHLGVRKNMLFRRVVWQKTCYMTLFPSRQAKLSN